jgi:hypothetical protein
MSIRNLDSPHELEHGAATSRSRSSKRDEARTRSMSFVANRCSSTSSRCIFFALLPFFIFLAPSARAADAPLTEAAATIVLVVGASGEPQYARDFELEVKSWQATASAAKARLITIGDTAPAANASTDLDRLKQALVAEPKTGLGELWIVLIGHGTFDGKISKFNLRGPDFSAAELADWLKPFQRPLAVIDTSSASAPFLAALSAPNRVIVTSTRNGFEQNYARFGRFFAQALADPKSDLDRDGQVSLLEAFLVAARQTNEFYKTEGRLATEHALIDDNGDGLGTPADWFRGTRAIKRARDNAELDGGRARQLCLVRSTAERELSPAVRARRDDLEREIEKLRETKSTMPEQDYYDQLEKLMLKLAAVYEDT